MPSWKDMALPSSQVTLVKMVTLAKTMMLAKMAMLGRTVKLRTRMTLSHRGHHQDCLNLRDFPGHGRKNLQGRRRGYPGPLKIPSRRWSLSLHTHRRDSLDLPTIQGHRWKSHQDSLGLPGFPGRRWKSFQYLLRGCPDLQDRPNFRDPRHLSHPTSQGRRGRKTRTMKVPEMRRPQRALPMLQQMERQSILQTEQQKILQMGTRT
jgi:hypothetical protein